MSTIATSVAYATISAGMHPSHTLPIKLRAIAEAGFAQAELSFPDLDAYASQEFPGYQGLDESGKGDVDTLMQASGKVHALCEELGISVLVMHPFGPFEGYSDPDRRAAGLERAAVWFKILKAIGCQMLQVGSNPDPSTSSDFDVIARDLRELADRAAAQDPPIRVVYEMWSQSPYVNTWQHTWEVCKRVDRPNFGLCLGTFHICARAYADPMSANGLLQDPPEGSALMALSSSLKALAATLPPEKIFYLQISDGSKVPPDVLNNRADERGISVLHAWSIAWRLFPYMDEVAPRKDKQSWGGYLPVLDVCDAVLRTGWRGPWSYEAFFEEDMSKNDTDVPSRWTRAAHDGHGILLENLHRRGF